MPSLNQPPLPRCLHVMVLIWLLGGVAGGVHAQETSASRASPAFVLDKHLFDRLYQVRSPAFRHAMRGADATAWPVFFGGAAAAWVGVWQLRGDDDWTDAYRLTLSEVGALGATIGLKYIVRRTRPYVRFADIDSRKGDIARKDPYSFPSGHAAISFAMATSWTLSHPKWYVAVPGYLWATGMSVSRVWLGVHYPSDVLAGAVLGVVVAWGIHELGAAVTPDALQKDRNQSPAPLIHLRLVLP